MFYFNRYLWHSTKNNTMKNIIKIFIPMSTPIHSPIIIMFFFSESLDLIKEDRTIKHNRAHNNAETNNAKESVLKEILSNRKKQI